MEAIFEGICPECLGRRISLGSEYPDFHDKAVDYRMCKLGYDVDYNTIRDESCPLCKGLDYYGPSQVEINGFRYSYHMLSPIFDLPNVMVLPPETQTEPMLFKADGFEGMTMPILID